MYLIARYQKSEKRDFKDCFNISGNLRGRNWYDTMPNMLNYNFVYFCIYCVLNFSLFLPLHILKIWKNYMAGHLHNLKELTEFKNLNWNGWYTCVYLRDLTRTGGWGSFIDYLLCWLFITISSTSILYSVGLQSSFLYNHRDAYNEK